MIIEKIEKGELKRVILKNGMIFTVEVTEVVDNTIRGMDKFGKVVDISGDAVSVILSIDEK